MDDSIKQNLHDLINKVMACNSRLIMAKNKNDLISIKADIDKAIEINGISMKLIEELKELLDKSAH